MLFFLKGKFFLDQGKKPIVRLAAKQNAHRAVTNISKFLYESLGIPFAGADREGYCNNPKASAEAIDADGRLHSGDLAYRDEDGCYYIGGRQKEMHISSGKNIYPLEVESALYTHPAVREAAVFGVHSRNWGEVGRAVISVKPGASMTEESLAAGCVITWRDTKCHIVFLSRTN